MFDNIKKHIDSLSKETERIFLEIIEVMKENNATMWNTAFDARICPKFIHWDIVNGNFIFFNVVGLFLDGDGSKTDHLKVIVRPTDYDANISNDLFAHIVKNLDTYPYKVYSLTNCNECVTYFAYRFARCSHMYKAGLISMTSESMIKEIEEMVKRNDGYVLLTNDKDSSGIVFLNADTFKRVTCKQLVLKYDYSDGNRYICSLHLIDDKLRTWNLEDYLDEDEIKMVYERVKENTTHK